MATVNTIAVEPKAFDVLYDFLPLGVMALARDRSVKVWNRCMERWSGVVREQVTGRRLGDLSPDLMTPSLLTDSIKCSTLARRWFSRPSFTVR